MRLKYWLLIFLALVGLMLYWPGLEGPYYSDDFKFVFDRPAEKILYFFGHENPNLAMYRPLQSMVLAIVQSFFGLSTLPIHLLTLLVHILFSWCLFLAGSRMGFSTEQSAFTSVIMLVSQANAMAILGNDTLSQVAGTFFGFLSLWYFYRMQPSRESDTAPSRSLYLLSILFFAVSLWFKETSLTFLLALSAVAIDLRPPVRGLRHTLVRLLPFYLISLLFLLVRMGLVSSHSADRYDFVVGFNVPKNLLMAVFSALVPVSSVSAYQAYLGRDFLFILLAILLTAGFAVLVSFGLLKQRYPLSFRIVVFAAIANLVPVTFLRHVSELYSYHWMPAFAMLFGIGVANVFAIVRRRIPVFVALATFCALVLAGHGSAIVTKATLASENGHRAADLMNEIRHHLHDVEPNGNLVLLNPMHSTIEYSVFLVEGFNVLKYGTNILMQISGREDIQIWILDERDGLAVPPHSLVLTLVNGHVEVWRGLSPAGTQGG